MITDHMLNLLLAGALVLLFLLLSTQKHVKRHVPVFYHIVGVMTTLVLGLVLARLLGWTAWWHPLLIVLTFHLVVFVGQWIGEAARASTAPPSPGLPDDDQWRL